MDEELASQYMWKLREEVGSGYEYVVPDYYSVRTVGMPVRWIETKNLNVPERGDGVGPDIYTDEQAIRDVAGL